VGDIGITLAAGEYRSEEPSSFEKLYYDSFSLIDDLSYTISTTNTTLSNEERKIRRLREAAGKDGYGSAVVSMSAFDSLQALSNGMVEATSCCICLDALGSNDGSETGSGNKASISMTKCGVSGFCRRRRLALPFFKGSRLTVSLCFLFHFRSTCIAEAV